MVEPSLAGKKPTEERKSRSPEKKPPPAKREPVGNYVGKPKELYEFLKDEYQKRRGIAFTVSGIHVGKEKVDETEIQKRKREEAEKRAGVLVEFWKQHFVVKRPFTRSSTVSRVEETRKTADASSNAMKDRVATYTEEEVRFTVREDIEKEICEIMAQAEKAKRASQVLEEHGKMEEEKRNFQKALNLHYSFERENLAE
ncbi:MAG: hypothetical protein P4L67_04155 [Candidatus Pacebacteria bacterium]|nr:hypothetical protein [Candidatus Paceibacterota bacterium]